SVMISTVSPDGLITVVKLLPGAQWTQGIRSLATSLATTSLSRTAATFSFSGQITSRAFGETRKQGRPFTSNDWVACQEMSCASTRHFFMQTAKSQKVLALPG